MISGDAYKLLPYRIEWRPDLTCHWTLITQVDEHPGDLEKWAREHDCARELQKGQWRVITQHVILARGLGA